jgi:hypothetical protein
MYNLAIGQTLCSAEVPSERTEASRAGDSWTLVAVACNRSYLKG